MGVCWRQLETDDGRRKRMGCLGVCVWSERHVVGLSVCVCVLERLGCLLGCGARDWSMCVQKACKWRKRLLKMSVCV